LAIVWNNAPQTAVGSYAVTATINDVGYQGSASGTFEISKASQTITFVALSTKTYGDASFALTATASSGLPVSYVSSDPLVASVAGSTVTILKAGTTTITANQAGNANYHAAVSVPQTLTVNPGPLDHYAVSVTSPQTAGEAFLITVTAQDSGNNTVTSDSATVVTMTGTGGIQFDANGDDTFGDNTRTLAGGMLTLTARDSAIETISITATSAGGKTGTRSGLAIGTDPQPGAYRSATSGNWTTLATWQRWSGTSWATPTVGEGVPSDAAGAITVQNGHTVTVTANVQVDQFVVQAGGQVTVNGGQSLTVANGVGPDGVILGTLRVNGATGSEGTITGSGALYFENGGRYQHNYTTAAGTIPSAHWRSGSICEIMGYTTAANGPGGVGQAFDTVIWNCSNQTAHTVLNGVLATVNLCFRLAHTGSGSLTLNAANTYAGSTVIAGGILRLGPSGPNRLPTGTAVVIENGAVLDLNGVCQTVNSLEGGGVVTNQAAGMPVTLTLSANGTKTFSGIIADGVGRALTLVMTSQNGWGGKQYLSGANRYSGGTRIESGILKLDNAAGSGTGSGGVIISNATETPLFGTLDNQRGGITGDIKVYGSAEIKPGRAPFRVGSLTLSDQTIVNLDLHKDTATISNDMLVVSGNLDLADSTCKVYQVEEGLVAGGTYTLITYTGLRTGTFADIIFSGSGSYLPPNRYVLTYDDSSNPRTVKFTAFTTNAPSVCQLRGPVGSSVYGQPVAFTSTVTAGECKWTGPPGGMVRFKEGDAILGESPLSAGVATFIASGLAAGEHEITAEYLGDENFSSSLSSIQSHIVTRATLTVALIAPIHKIYDGNSLATLTDTNYRFTGLIGVERPRVTKLTGTYATSNAGSGIVVSTSLMETDFTESSGFLKANYNLPTTAAGNVGVIECKPATVTAGDQGKIYGETVTFAGTEFTSDGFISGDSVSSVTLTSAGAAATAGKGAYDILPCTAVGTGLANYDIRYEMGTLTVDPLAVTVTGAVAQNKIHDGTTAAVISGAILLGVVEGSDVSLDNLVGIFAQSAIGRGIGVTAALTLKGVDAGNYSLIQPTGLKADIKPALNCTVFTFH
jgi:autotransporter-associated beta strand protein